MGTTGHAGQFHSHDESAPSTGREPNPLEVDLRSAEHSSVPALVVQAQPPEIRYANAAFRNLVRCPASALVARPLLDITSESERVLALLERALSAWTTELAHDVAYLCDDGAPVFGTTLVTPVHLNGTPGLLVRVIETTQFVGTHEARAAQDLRDANQRLLLASMREQELAERAEQHTLEIEELLARRSLLSEANALLSSSLDFDETLERAARLPVPELCDLCVIELVRNGVVEQGVLVHADEQEQEALRKRPLFRSNAECCVGALETLRSACPVLCDDLTAPHATATLGADRVAFLRELGARALLSLPLLARGEVIGLVSLLDTAPARSFPPRDVEVAKELARRASLAIDNARLYREAQSAVRAREDVLAIVAHDLRNPLGAILMTSRRLLKGKAAAQDSDLARSLGIVGRAAAHMRSLIEELLDIASIHTGQLQLTREQVHVHELVAQTLEMLEPLAKQAQLRLACKLPEAVPPGDCDKERVVRVLSNLLGNAIKFTPPGGTIELTVEPHDGELCFGVRDTGPGIGDADRKQLFQPYWRGNASGRRGMGLGLYVSRGIVTAHGGRIWVDSEPGKGSHFQFTLPASAR